VDIGTYPRDPKPLEIVNYEDGRGIVDDGTFSAWGHLEYAAPLPPEALTEYELRPSSSNPQPEREEQEAKT
jgi:hypothetical protein